MTAKPLDAQLLSRRDAMLRFSAAAGASFVGGAAILAGCASPDSRPVDRLFGPADLALLDEISETILPATSTPGAKAAEVGQFIALMVADTYRLNEQQIFVDGLRRIDEACQRDFGRGFMDSSPEQRTSLLERLDREQFEMMNGSQPDGEVHYFRMLKELTLQGYFTSEIGYTQAMRYLETPGVFDPCAPYSPGDRAWADHA